jgi:hypothetical protein
MPDITWTAILASSVIAALLGGVIAGFVTLRVAKNQYVNDYYKTVVQRRLAAYEQLEHLITMLKTSVADDNDNKVYHLLFADGDNSKAFEVLFRVSSQSMWLSDEVVDETVNLNRLLFSFPGDQPGIYAFAKEHYKTIAETRTRLERLHSRDFLTLHEVARFLKSKKPKDSYGQLPSRA